MSIEQGLKTGIKTILNFTLGKVIPTALGAIEKQIPKTIERYEKDNRITDAKIDEIYDKSHKFYETIDTVYNVSNYLNDKVNDSKFLNDESKKDM